MLNTESRSAAGLIWLAILAIIVRALWTLLDLGSPIALARTITQSGLAGFIGRNQIIVTGLAGFGALALAYLFNGWRDRAERRHVGERAEMRLANVLAREAMSLGSALEDLAKAPTSGGGSANAKGRLAEAIAADDRLLLAAPMPELARLGAGATVAIQAVRRSVRRLATVSEMRDEAGQRQVPVAAIEAAFAARDAVRVLDVVATKGSAAADRLRLMPRQDGEVRALLADHAEVSTSKRLLPAA